MSEPWIQAGEKVGKDKKLWLFCEWDNFSEEAGWGTYSGRGGWTKRQFKAALREMPKDHPDRWMYEAGAKYASVMNEDNAGMAMVSIMGKLMVLAGSVIFGIISLSLVLSGYYGNLLLAVPSMAVWVYAGHWFYKRHQVMKRMLKPTPPVRRLGEFF